MEEQVQITITSGSTARSYDAATGREAVRMWFDDVKTGKIALSELGVMGEWSDGSESIPFRIVPALVACGYLTHSQMPKLFKLAGLDFTSSELTEMVNADAWMVRLDSDIKEVTTVQ
jgi:hypothetical protein